MAKAEQGAPAAHEPKHTPGPWDISPHSMNPDAHTWIVTTGKIVARLGLTNEKHANAKLIAAAPDLYSVLKALLDDMEDNYDGAPDSGSRWMGWHIAKAKEALAKAEGATK